MIQKRIVGGTPMTQKRIEELANGFLNGNISWTRANLWGSRRWTAAVAAYIQEYSPSSLESFLRLMEG